jgi:hypothetical protein
LHPPSLAKEHEVKSAGRVRRLLYAYFSKPQHERVLFRAMKRTQPARVVEIGLGDARRATRLVAYAQALVAGPVNYTGIDLFEDRLDAQTCLRLKDAYRQLHQLGAKVRLFPGEPLEALRTAANGLTGTDLLVVSRQVDPESMRQAWAFVPRMLHERSLVFVEQVEPDDGVMTFRQLSLENVDAAARQAKTGRRAAA